MATTIRGRSVKVQWNNFTPPRDIQKYEVKYGTDSPPTQNILFVNAPPGGGVVPQEIMLHDLDPAQTYNVQVFPYDAMGSGAGTQIVNFIPEQIATKDIADEAITSDFREEVTATVSNTTTSPIPITNDITVDLTVARSVLLTFSTTYLFADGTGANRPHAAQFQFVQTLPTSIGLGAANISRQAFTSPSILESQPFSMIDYVDATSLTGNHTYRIQFAKTDPTNSTAAVIVSSRFMVALFRK